MNLILPELEKNILDFWKKNRIFEKSLELSKGKPRFIFFEGPPFANGLPGIHHLLARAFKDIILRYKTMRGFYVERKAGWDTHGLPTEMSAEKSLQIKSKKEIEKDISRFIEECRKNVFTYKKEWEDFTERIGFWLDLDNSYITCSNEYIESLWWILKQIWEKNLLVQDYKVVPYCPRCGTSLSSHEVAQGYKKIKENSVYVKMQLKGKKDTFLLVWTTTPWTLPGNAAVAVNPDFKYVKVKIGKEVLILAKERLSVLGEDCQIIEEVKGKDLLGLEYVPLFDFYKPEKKTWFVISGDFVSLEEGTGLVHIAPAFGEDDMEVGKENDLPVILNVDEEGKFKDEVKTFAGKFVKTADPLIIEELKKRGVLFKEELYEHEYPFCWRCDSPLLYYAKQSWFIKVSQFKEDLIKNNKSINWVPSYLKDGRFGEWLKDAKDWNLSRERYWGTPLPIWECQKCEKQICIGSLEELKSKTKEEVKLEDLHKPLIDEVILKCDCGGEMKRVKEVIDCWFDSGSMPFAQWHYPFENKNLIDKKEFFPADFISEAIDQTRGWFYTLLVISVVLGLSAPYKNVISVGIVLDEKGQKMSKSKGNIVKPSDIIDKYGADVARFYFYTVNQVAEPKIFNFRDVQTLYRNFFDTLINTQTFFNTYVEKGLKIEKNFKPKSFLNKWIISRLEELNLKVVENLENYDVVSAARLFEEFVDDFSNWYIRRSRKIFQQLEVNEGKKESSQALAYCLFKLSKLLAPFTPFLAESLYKDFKEKDSVHLDSFPEPRKELIDGDLKEKMMKVREIVRLGLKARADLGIKVKQPLNSLEVGKLAEGLEEDILYLAKEELNLKSISFKAELKDNIKLDDKITPELEREGIEREILRTVKDLRKKINLTPQDMVVNISSTASITDYIVKEDFIKKTGAKEFIKVDTEKEMKVDIKKEIEIKDQKHYIGIKK